MLSWLRERLGWRITAVATLPDAPDLPATSLLLLQIANAPSRIRIAAAFADRPAPPARLVQALHTAGVEPPLLLLALHGQGALRWIYNGEGETPVRWFGWRSPADPLLPLIDATMLPQLRLPAADAAWPAPAFAARPLRNALAELLRNALAECAEAIGAEAADQRSRAARLLAQAILRHYVQLRGWRPDELQLEAPPAAVARMLAPLSFSAAGPNEIEIGWNQDLLGDACEALIADRHDNGAFYTAPADAARMCRLSLAAYLAARCPAAGAAQIDALLRGEPHILTPPQQRALAAALHDLAVCDPALGAGIMLVMMLRQIRAAQAALEGAAPDPAALIVRSLRGADIDPAAVEFAKLRLQIELLAAMPAPAPLLDPAPFLFCGDALGGAPASPGQPQALDDRHIVWPRADAATFARENPGYDIVIANPPYLRQEVIDRTFAAHGLSLRKAELRTRFAALPGGAPPGQSDLYMYFYFRALHLLRRGGIGCVISSNSWLDVSFGAALRRALTTTATIRLLIDCGDGPAFERADVNAAIILFANRPPEHEREPVALINAAGESRMIEIGTLRSVGGAQPWGAPLLRAPDLLTTIRHRLGDRLVALDTRCQLARGTTTGNNGFFLLDAARAAALGLPDSLLRPVLCSTREPAGLTITADDLARRLFVCPYSIAELQALGYDAAVEYIHAAADAPTAARGRQSRAGVATAAARTLRDRARWWSLRAHSGQLVVARLVRERYGVWLNPEAIPATDMFFNLRARRAADAPLLGALLNSVLTYLWMETLGRINIGGRINLYGPELRGLPIADPACITAGDAEAIQVHFAPLAQRAALPIEQEVRDPVRERFDRLLLDAIGLADLYEPIVEALLLAARRRRRREGG